MSDTTVVQRRQAAACVLCTDICGTAMQGAWLRIRRCLILIGLCPALIAQLARAQQTTPVRPEAIQGSVREAAGHSVSGATVVATAVPSAESQVAESDANGLVSLTFAHGTGNYIIRVSAPGFRVARLRLLRAHDASTDSTLRFTAVLTPDSARVLTAVRVAESRRQRPSVRESRTDLGGASPEAMKALDPLARGDLATLAQTVPGVLASADGSAFSVLGLSPADNVVLLNGLAFGPTEIPASARVDVRLRTSAYDPAIGGFSGGALSVVVAPGSNFGNGSIEGSLEAPTMQFTDRLGQELGREFHQFRLGGYRSGAVVRDKIFFNGSAQVSRHTSDAISLASASPSVLEHAGTTAPAAARLFMLLDSLKIPRGTPDAGRPVIEGHTSGLARFDFFPSSTRALNAVFSIDHHTIDPSLLSPLGTPSVAGSVEKSSLSGQLEYARYFENFYLVRARSGFASRASSLRAANALPAGIVLATPSASATSPLFTALTFGGSAVAPQHDRVWSWQNTLEAAWFSPDNRHRPAITGGLVLQGGGASSQENAQGTFVFNSFDDLAADRPASFTRSLGETSWGEHEVSGWLSLGDVWRPVRGLSLQYGARVEASRYQDAPDRNPQLEDALGLRTDVLPGGVAVLPRVAFAWSYGSDSRVSFAGPSPKGTIRGGFGAFRSMLDVSLPGQALLASGQPGDALALSCIGSAAPVPQWLTYTQSPASIPSTCASGAPTFATVRPNVVAFAPDYRPSEAWRGNVGWAGSVLGLHATADALVSFNLYQPGTTDRNLVLEPSFSLPYEGGRPVFVPVSAIDPVSGGVSLAASRHSPLAARVVELTSHGRSRSEQLAFTLSPVGGVFVTRWWTLGYALTRVDDRANGFDGGAFADPRTYGPWGPARSDVRHTISGSGAWQIGDATRVRLNAQLRSGAPFTPLVLGDPNGDGIADDRAFIFDPADAPSSDLAPAMTELLASSNARCLRQHIGSVAPRNSCRGPWTATSSAQVSFEGQTVGLTNRTSFEITASNLLAGLDLALHGARGARGWGQAAVPDPVLLAVRGFDTATRSFRYAVNPHFGDPTLRYASFRAPFTLSIHVSVSLGKSYPEQLTDDLLAPGRSEPGERLTADQLAARYARSGILDPIPFILVARDSLLLSAGQLAAMTALHARYTARTDSLWSALGHELAGLGTEYDHHAVLQRIHTARYRAYGLLAEAAREIRALLTPDQLALISPDLLELLDDKAIERLQRNDARSY